MSAKNGNYGCQGEVGQCFEHNQEIADSRKNNRPRRNISGIIDHKVVLLSMAGAAVKSHCDPCLKEIVLELEETGIREADIRQAVKSGWFLGVDAELEANAVENASGCRK